MSRDDPADPPRDATPSILVSHEFAPFRGGVATYVQEVASAAARLGRPVEVWTVDYRHRESSGKERGVPDDSSLPFPVVRFASDGRLTPRGLLSLAWGFYQRRRELRGRRVVLLSVGAQMAFFLLHAPGLIPASRVICLCHGSEILRFQRSRFWGWLARRFYARAEGFAVHSFHVEHLLRGSGLLPEGASIAFAPCACPTVFQGGSAAMGTTADDGVWRVLTVARLHPRKGQLEAARALALLTASQRARLVYQVVGTGDASYRRQVEDACRAGGVRCEFLGALDDGELGAVYRHATVYVQASLTLPRSIEGFGITFLEASIHGCPVVAYRSGGVAEAVRDGVTGWLVAEGDRAALAAAVGRLLDDPASRATMGKAGRTFARGFRWETAAQVLCR